MRRKTKQRRILLLHVEFKRFTDVMQRLVNGGPLCDDGNLEAFCHVESLTLGYDGVDHFALQRWSLADKIRTCGEGGFLGGTVVFADSISTTAGPLEIRPNRLAWLLGALTQQRLTTCVRTDCAFRSGNEATISAGLKVPSARWAQILCAISSI